MNGNPYNDAAIEAGMNPYSERANEKAQRNAEREGEISFSDLSGICEPNPDLPGCTAWLDTDTCCQLLKNHDGPHRQVIEWEVRR